MFNCLQLDITTHDSTKKKLDALKTCINSAAQSKGSLKNDGWRQSIIIHANQLLTGLLLHNQLS